MIQGAPPPLTSPAALPPLRPNPSIRRSASFHSTRRQPAPAFNAAIVHSRVPLPLHDFGYTPVIRRLLPCHSPPPFDACVMHPSALRPPSSLQHLITRDPQATSPAQSYRHPTQASAHSNSLGKAVCDVKLRDHAHRSKPPPFCEINPMPPDAPSTTLRQTALQDDRSTNEGSRRSTSRIKLKATTETKAFVIRAFEGVSKTKVTAVLNAGQ
ncbi:hypothetical protein DFP72DRAFT_1178633 [Ephemerocybe angulata]|uniref:Uncharacterized protein n=1 Tax=Ephemerocybe angulata TaxID=980116 RepID=A0A8H6LW98_9AGAR|nr:hypothetical protein DFP72DRAFT_1178633 [Tulosesus angulatus]